MISLLIEVPISTDIDSMETQLQELVSSVRGAWTWQGREVAGKRLLDCVIPYRFDWKSLLPVADRVYEEGEQPVDPALQTLIDALGWRLVGAWYWDGISKDKVVYDVDGQPTGEVVEAITRLFPERTGDPLTDQLHIDVLNYMEDDVVYDSDGNELSRSRPTAPKEVHSWGWPART